MPKIYKGIKTIALHPSCKVEELLEQYDMTFLDLVRKENIQMFKMRRFMKGLIGVDSEIAYLLSRKLNTSINLWFNLQRKYKKDLIKAKEENKNGKK
ncbi:hypothetical protein [Peptacetobacter sp. AB800]|uniref:hypothetical protein n=1 Tax=Peptacetobacter sp. AB800 TaxID=3388428 RepID=UPI0039FDBF1F